MLGIMLAVVSQSDAIFFAIFLLVIFMLIVGLFFLTAWMRKFQQGISPYTGMPLRHATDIPYASLEKILRFLFELHEYDNRIFKLSKAAMCRETGRIFPDCISWMGTVRVDWDFLKKRYPGNYVSWGSLTDAQRELIISLHDNLNGFQTEFSSPQPSPSAVEPQFAFTKPGPLYVDLHTKILLGWKKVPGTLFEVLIVQKPKNPYKV